MINNLISVNERINFIKEFVKKLFYNSAYVVSLEENYNTEWLDGITKSVYTLTSLYSEVGIWLFKIETSPDEKEYFKNFLVEYIRNLMKILDVIYNGNINEEGKIDSFDFKEEDIKYLNENSKKVIDVILKL